MLAGELRHHSHVECIPVADQFFLGGEGESDGPEGPAVIYSAHVVHRAGMSLWSVGHFVSSGLGGPPDNSVSHEVWVGPGGPDDGSRRSGSKHLVWPDESYRWLV